ncbi:hypothetical protein [Saccharibacillus sp. JS10]|uniref:hypothetical protein n=1 Tax=Saccharibacillus sp. JS10 TaxID=2950552 RepID=UPI00210925B9|nr:hypothetical protein [Saccharibacillus sp. JS10]MCQ4087170.1 hypothetical protein [Saccharibacillus sp. JS10]
MNIGSLFKNIIGDSKPGEFKQVDLRAGQVVRGVVQSVSEDGKEAVIQIQGVKVNAQLETPLQAGQTAFMEVQPATEDGTIVMKPVAAPPGAAASAQSIEQTLKQLGLPDNKQNRDMITMMQKADIPLTKENSAEVKTLMAQKPATVDAQQWVRSIGILQQRGLPVTPQSVSGMHQAVFGAPASTLLQNLEQQISAALGQSGQAEDGNQGVTGRPANANVVSGANTSTTVNSDPSGKGQTHPAQTSPNSSTPVATNNTGSATTTAGAQSQTAPDTDSALPATNLAKATERAVPATGAAPTASAPTSGSPNLAQSNVANTPEAPPNRSSTSNQTVNSGRVPTGESQLQPSDATLLRKVQSLLGELRTAAASSTESANAAQGQNAAASSQTENADSSPWVGRLLKMLGAEHEQQTARSTLLNTPASNATPNTNAASPPSGQPTAQPNTPSSNPPVTNSNAQAASQAQATTQASAPAQTQAQSPQQPPISAAVRQAAEQALRAIQGDATSINPSATADDRSVTAAPAAQQSVAEVRETLKSLLLQLSNSDTLPAGLKDAVQQTLQQMTGQQLLLNTDRTAPFAQVTMFLPFVGPDGNQTASVQIESRRGPKGELDASNCRLWFDLDMKSLGRTVIDVQVVDRNVSLNVRNDEEWARPLLEAGQPQITSALESAGYQLMALRFDTLPEKATSNNGDSGTALSYTPPSYRAVDVKV